MSIHRPTVVDAEAPADRLAVFRVLTGICGMTYLLVRLPELLALRHADPAAFAPVGLLAALDRPLPSPLLTVLLSVTIATGAAYTGGVRYRCNAPVFAAGMVVLTTYHGSWGQLLHFENLMVLHLLVMACAPAADRLAVDARRHRPPSRPPTAYGWPLALAGLTTVVTYLVAGIAKLRYGGLAWVTGDTLRNHVAYSAARLDLLGGTPSPLAGVAVRHGAIFPVLAFATVLIELAAPVAMFGGRLRTAWVAAAWGMHVGILALMLIVFHYPLFGIAFTPFFHLERLVPGRWRPIS